MLHGRGIEIEGTANQAGNESLGSNFDHLIRLVLSEGNALVFDSRDGGSGGKQAGEKILGSDGVIRAMHVHSLVVLRPDDVFDVKFREHGLMELGLC